MNAFTTTRYWLEKTFLLLRKYYESTPVILSGKVYFDETFYRVDIKNVQPKEDGTRKRGLSRDQYCVGVARSGSNTVCILEGNGKPSKGRVWDAFGSIIAPGSTLIHDGESAHQILIDNGAKGDFLRFTIFA